MGFELKDLISPVITVSCVWIGSRLTLKNEIRKNLQKIEIERLGRLAIESDTCLRNVHAYCMRLQNLLHDLSSGYEKKITQADVTLALKKSADAGTAIDFESVYTLQNNLELYRPAEFDTWKKIILPLLTHINFVIASPSLAKDDCAQELSHKYWNAEQVREFNVKLKNISIKLPLYRQHLFQVIANDYKALTQPTPLNLWLSLERAKNAIWRFLKFPTIFSQF